MSHTDKYAGAPPEDIKRLDHTGPTAVSARDIVVRRGKRDRRVTTADHISLDIAPGEMIAVAGSSGAGKSTLMNVLSGNLKPDEGSVYIGGHDLYSDPGALKNRMGYVPQSDIVYDDLTLEDMLRCTAGLRLPGDMTKEEKQLAVDRAIRTVGLEDKRDLLIRHMSGGQKKRACIAVELLADPGLLFLDEPASGLDPVAERNLMTTLREMTENGRTVILVTNNPVQLDLCDRVLFIGSGGRLCFCGSMTEARAFFGTDDDVRIYHETTEHAQVWQERFDSLSAPGPVQAGCAGNIPKAKKGTGITRVLCARYIRLILNDRKRLALLLLQAPLLALLIALMTTLGVFNEQLMTKAIFFCFTCSAFWIGMLNAIREVCKERTVFRREYMAGLSPTRYILSKVIVLGILCALQSLLLTGTFSLLRGIPEAGARVYSLFDPLLGNQVTGPVGPLLGPFAEMYVTTFLSTLAASAAGLAVSCLFRNPDRAMTAAPLMLMPQILFSGILFKLSSIDSVFLRRIAGALSCCTVSRWSMEAYGVTANMNSLPVKFPAEANFSPELLKALQIDAESFDFQNSFGVRPDQIRIYAAADPAFAYSEGHLLTAWGVLLLIILLCIAAACVMVRDVRKEEN